MIPLTSPHWRDYELIDTGGREKLERFGDVILARPEPQAVWGKALGREEWMNLSHAWFRKSGARGQEPAGERGEWHRKPGVAEQWMISYQNQDLRLKFRLGLTSFGHIGVFPEQADNWEWVFNRIRDRGTGSPDTRVLNLFAYTGGASLAACAAGAAVTHVDSVRPVITWAKEDMEACGLDGIRWVVEDALKFVRREAKRGNLYDGIILDPPAYGRGPEGEKWVLEDSVDEIISLCSRILRPEKSFFILSLYSMGFSSLIGENLVRTYFPEAKNLESGEFYFADRAGRKLPLGTVVRFF